MNNVLVIGLGQIGMGYDLNTDEKTRVATLARAFNEHPGFELVAGVDTEQKRRSLFSEHYRKPAFSNLRSAVDEVKADVIAISVPTDFHFNIFSQVLELCSPKVILCEKPLSYDLDEAKKMVSLAEEANVELFTNYMRRCDSAIIEVKRQLDSCEISWPVKGVCWYSKGLFNNGSHFLNLLQYWLGEVLSFKIINKGRMWNNNDPEPDIAIQFKLGEVIFLAAREENFSHYTIELLAANGRLRYENRTMEWQQSISDNANSGYVTLDSKVKNLSSDFNRLQWYVVDQIASFMSNDKTTICTGVQGLSTLEILSQIREQL